VFSVFSALFVMMKLSSFATSVTVVGIAAILGAVVILTLSEWGSLAMFQTLLTFDFDNDASLSERADSIVIGLQSIADNPLGVGPGLSGQFNQYTIPHQFIVAQGSEIGALGAVFPTLIFLVLMLRAIRSTVVPGCAGDVVSFAFSCGALTWSVYAIVTNIAVNSGPTIPWIGMLALFAALGARIRYRDDGYESPHGR
jgi:O-antigen ligase